MKVLVVDDCPDGAASLSLVLSCLGHDVRTALSGLQGLEEFERFLPEVVVCDLHMPDLPGEAVAQRLRASAGLRRPLLFSLSGDNTAAAQSRSLLAGFDAHFGKPLDLDSLNAKLRWTLSAP